MSMNKGITIAGNILVDAVKMVSTYPQIGKLADIYEVKKAVGGCVPNTIIDLARMQGGIPLSACGRIGADEAGRFVLDAMRSEGVNTDGVSVSQSRQTSFSDAMSAVDTGERTFFHYRGANAEFSPANAPAESLNCDLLHIGYILLLDAFDEPDSEYGTVMARYLHDVQQQGILTSIDVVSDNSADYGQKIIPALRYCNYAIMNEKNLELYAKYTKLLEEYPNFYLLGRLAEYKYYNIDAIVDKALSLADMLLG